MDDKHGGRRTQTCITPAGIGKGRYGASVCCPSAVDGRSTNRKGYKNNDGKRDGFTFGVFADEACLDQIDTLISDQRVLLPRQGFCREPTG